MDARHSPRYRGTLEAKELHTSKAAGCKTPKVTKKTVSLKRQWRSSSSSLPQGNIVGRRFSHGWREEDGLITRWKGTILHQVTFKPSLFMVKYDGVDCVCGVELQKDKRISALKILPELIQASEVADPILADALIGKEVEHTFESEDGSKSEYSGMILAKAPILNDFFYITYYKDPILFMYQLLDDFHQGDLRILPDLKKDPERVMELELSNDLIGQGVVYKNGDGTQNFGQVIYRVEGRPTLYFIKFDDDFHIYVYKLDEN